SAGALSEVPNFLLNQTVDLNGVHTLKKIYFLISLLIVIVIMTGCIQFLDNNKINKVGMLVEGSLDDSTWNKKGLQRLQHPKDEFETDTIYAENINENQTIIHAVHDFVEEGVNLIYGHGSYFATTFVEIATQYPHVPFIYFSCNHYAQNVTSVQLISH